MSQPARAAALQNGSRIRLALLVLLGIVVLTTVVVVAGLLLAPGVDLASARALAADPAQRAAAIAAYQELLQAEPDQEQVALLRDELAALRAREEQARWQAASGAVVAALSDGDCDTARRRLAAMGEDWSEDLRAQLAVLAQRIDRHGEERLDRALHGVAEQLGRAGPAAAAAALEAAEALPDAAARARHATRRAELRARIAQTAVAIQEQTAVQPAPAPSPLPAATWRWDEPPGEATILPPGGSRTARITLATPTSWSLLRVACPLPADATALCLRLLREAQAGHPLLDRSCSGLAAIDATALWHLLPPLEAGATLRLELRNEGTAALPLSLGSITLNDLSVADLPPTLRCALGDGRQALILPWAVPPEAIAALSGLLGLPVLRPDPATAAALSRTAPLAGLGLWWLDLVVSGLGSSAADGSAGPPPPAPLLDLDAGGRQLAWRTGDGRWLRVDEQRRAGLVLLLRE